MRKELYSVACHIHTHHSYDGYNSFSAIYRTAKQYEIDCVCITDHDTIRGGIEFKRWLEKNKRSDLDVVVGSEITCENNIHIIGLFLTEEIKTKNCFDVIAEIKAQNGLVYLPHPARSDGVLASPDSQKLLKSADLYEIFNAKVLHGYNEDALKKKPHHLAPFGGSDSHYNIDIPKSICYISKSGSSREAFNSYLISRKIKITGLVKRTGSNNYFAPYYRYKHIIKLPGFIKGLAKIIYPAYKNFKERNRLIINEVLHDYF